MLATANYSSALSQLITTTTASAQTIAAPDHHPEAFNQSSQWLTECHQEGDASDHHHHHQQQQLYVNLSTFWYCFLALITAVGLLISLISNMIIIYLFTSTPSLRKNPSNIIAVNLSLSDLLYCVQWPSVIYCSLTQSTWILEYSFVCQSFGFITVSTALASILTVLAMSIERAIVISYSIHARNKFTIRSAWMIIVLIWIVSLSSCLPPLFGKFNRYTLDPSKTSCTLDYVSRQTNHKLYILVLYVAYWILPTILISISYIIIIVTFKKSSLDLKKISGETYDQSTSYSSAGRGHNHYFGRKLRDSFRLKGYISNPEQYNNSRLESALSNRRASASVLDLGSHFLESPAAHDKRGTFKRIASSSALQSRTMCQQIVVVVNNNVSNSGPNETTSSSSRNRSTTNLPQPQRDSELDRWRPSRANHQSANAVLFRPRIIKKTLSSIKALPQQAAANSHLTRTVLQFRLAKMSFYLILLWLVSWTPIASLAMINSVMKCYRASATAVFLASTMTKLGPALDVFIYGISHPKIKSRFRQIIGKLLFLNSACSTIKLQTDQND